MNYFFAVKIRCYTVTFKEIAFPIRPLLFSLHFTRNTLIVHLPNVLHFSKDKISTPSTTVCSLFLLFTKSYLMGIRLPLLERSVLYFYELLMSRLRRLQRHNCPHLKGLTYDLKIYVDNAVVVVRTTKTTIVDSEVQCKKSLSLKNVWLFPFYLHSTSLFTLF